MESSLSRAQGVAGFARTTPIRTNWERL